MKFCRIQALMIFFLLLQLPVWGADVNSDFVSQSVPTSMNTGETITVRVTFQNTGGDTWTDAASFCLGSQNPENNNTWGIGRAYLSGPIATAEIADIYFQIKAPSSPGTYAFQWRMLIEHVTWFGEFSPNIDIEVRLAKTPTPRNTRTITPTFTITRTRTQTSTGTPTLTVTPTPTITFTSTTSATYTATLTQTPTLTGTLTSTLTATPTCTPSRTPSASLTVTPSVSFTPTRTLSRTPSLTRTLTSTLTITPTRTVSLTQTPSASVTPTMTISATLTVSATHSPTLTMTTTATRLPTVLPTGTATQPGINLLGIAKPGTAAPNPFIPGVGQKTYFNLEPSLVSAIRIYNTQGRLVQTLQGTNEWDGHKANGGRCEGGVYIFQIETAKERVSGSVVLLER